VGGDRTGQVQLQDFRATWRQKRVSRYTSILFLRTCSVTRWGETGEMLNELGAKLGIQLTVTDRISVPPVRFSAEDLRTSNTSIVSKCFTVLL